MENFNDTFDVLTKLYESMLEVDTPYMLRRDGNLISCKELMIHPYINTIPTSAKNKTAAYKFLLDNGERDNYEWFLKYSQNDQVKKVLTTLLAGKVKDADLEATLSKLRYETNQEFCRVRTSGKFLGNPYNREIYFRISSFGFNWFDLIWQVVHDNKKSISSVTVCTDEKSKGRDECYTYRGVELSRLPTEEFLTLPGNPVVEKVSDENKATTVLSEELELGSLCQ